MAAKLFFFILNLCVSVNTISNRHNALVFNFSMILSYYIILPLDKYCTVIFDELLLFAGLYMSHICVGDIFLRYW